MAATTAPPAASSASAAPRFARQFELLAPEYEVLDPNPDLHTLFTEYNGLFFEGKLAGCEVKWSPRMTLCAGLCSFQPRSGFCSIRLSEPLLKLRPRSDMVNTLLHEMIHAYVFVFSPVKDHDDHGTVFQAHMRRINETAGTRITVFHTFHDEVDAYRQHWWKCDGPCQRAPPYYGVVKRAMNRPPGPTDRWWEDHKRQCGGSYAKVKDPPGFREKQEKKRAAAEKREQKKRESATPSVKSFFPTVAALVSEEPDDADDAVLVGASETPGGKTASRPGASRVGSKAPGASADTAKKPKAKKPRVDATPAPPPSATSSSGSSTTSGSNGSSFRSSPPVSFPAAGLPDFPVVFAMDDGELFVAGDLHALFQQPSTRSAAVPVVDLTVSEDVGDGGRSGHEPSRTSDASSSRSTSVATAEVIEIDDD